MEPLPRKSLERAVDDALTTSSALGNLVGCNLIAVGTSDTRHQSIHHFNR